MQYLLNIPENHGRICDIDELIECIREAEGEDVEWAIALINWAASKRKILSEPDTISLFS